MNIRMMSHRGARFSPPPRTRALAVTLLVGSLYGLSGFGSAAAWTDQELKAIAIERTEIFMSNNRIHQFAAAVPAATEKMLEECAVRMQGERYAEAKECFAEALVIFEGFAKFVEPDSVEGQRIADAIFLLNEAMWVLEFFPEKWKRLAEQLAKLDEKMKEIMKEKMKEMSRWQTVTAKIAGVFRDCEVCPAMVEIPAGSYEMGSPEGEVGRDEDEGPLHRVTIGEPLAVGVYEVTVGEFGHFVEATGHSTGDVCSTHEDGAWEERSGRSWRNPGFDQTARHPVVCVSWDDAQAYVEWLSTKTGMRYRLLSESEWEYAARAGTSTAHYWDEGEAQQCRNANGADAALKTRFPDWKWDIATCDDGRAHTAAAGSYLPNGHFLHDMLGNVWEWVEDCWHSSYSGAPTDGSAWTSGECGERVFRGGAWTHQPRSLRAASRVGIFPGVPGAEIGFRVARTLTP